MVKFKRGYPLGLLTSPRSSPGPIARTLCAPPSVIGPTVNWNGLPIIQKHAQDKHDTSMCNKAKQTKNEWQNSELH